MNPVQLPIARELFAQWRRNRGERPAPASRPFSRDWETLLEDAAILAATDREEAVRDARALAAEGWLELKPVRYRPHLIDRVVLPFDAEERWRNTFGFVPETDGEALRIDAHPWHPAMHFVRTARLGIPFEDLRQLDAFLANPGTPARPSVPIKERSLGIFGDEKRLDVLADSALFREGRLTLEHLRCRIVPEPLAWRRGRLPEGPVIVLENVATWDTCCQLDARDAQFSGVVYGGGNRFVDGVAFLSEIFRELGGARPVLYFGDLDASGLRIPFRASRNALARGLPAVEPHLPLYQALLATASAFPPTPSDEPAGALGREDCAWLGPLAEESWQLLSRGGRLAQERVGFEAASTTG